MLALEKPLGAVADLALFADHADTRCVWYTATRPRLARIDGTDEIAFVKFRDGGAESGVGLLSFTTELAPTERQFELARDALERQGLSDIRFAPIPWRSGRAVFAAALQQGDGFVEQMLGEVQPDLTAGGRAMFSLRLSETGAKLVEALLTGDGPSPLGVRYELEYAGLRPALEVRIEADYDRIYQELAWGFQVGVAYEGIGVRASVESATKKLVEAGALRIEVLRFSDDAALASRVDAALRWMQDRLLEDFFKTSLQPPQRQNLLQQVIDGARRLGSSLENVLNDAGFAADLARELGLPVDELRRVAQAAKAGGSGAGAAGGASSSTFALKLQFSFRDIHEVEQKTFRFDWREAAPERRTAAPQGLLGSFGATPRIVEATDAGSFWDKLEVAVVPLGDFTSLGVRHLVAQLAFPDENAPDTQVALSFEPGELGPKHFSAWTDGRPPRYRGRSEVHFDDRGPWPGPPVWIGDWQDLQSLQLALHPLSGVPRLEIDIAPGSIVFAETPQAQVDLRLGEAIVATALVSEAAPTVSLKRRLERGADSVPEVRVTWFLAGGGRVEGGWAPLEGSTVLVHRPWRSTRTLRLLPMLPDDLLDALVTLTTTEGGRTQTQDVRFEPGERKARTVTIPSLAEQPPPVRIDVLVIRGDGSSFSGEPFESSEPVVVIRDRDGECRQVAVRLLAGATLQQHGLMALQVQLIDDGEAVLDDVVFTESQRQPGTLLVPVGAGLAPARYRVTRYRLDGSAQRDLPQAIVGSEVLVPAVVAPG